MIAVRWREVSLLLCVWRAEADVMDESLPEQILLDENAEAAKHSFYMVGGRPLLWPWAPP